MDLRDMGFDTTVLDTLHELLDLSDEADAKSHHAPSRAFLRDRKAMAATPADVKEYPNSYVFVLDMPGLKPDQIRVQVEDGNVLVVSGERKREKEKDQNDGAGGGLLNYIKMERRLGKFLKKFVLPENADTEKIAAAYQDGVLTVTVEKRPPPEPKKPKTIEVQIA
ncbi:17.1 kDa class II heat shock protein-like [Syzygium oleosum]|uniref:17.1 kDa class II heat shock protein-like n=1 Tax=Syzygium oleosum TaxID=219896 RepID=UPI0011D1F911|nr:17.1 kDa class II heat shock protein-like [Syzygium oleosum]XP_030448579.1 17.1 kDa class II heat shock protein-like [Syzygium oleosum]